MLPENRILIILASDIIRQSFPAPYNIKRRTNSKVYTQLKQSYTYLGHWRDKTSGQRALQKKPACPEIMHPPARLLLFYPKGILKNPSFFHGHNLHLDFSPCKLTFDN